MARAQDDDDDRCQGCQGQEARRRRLVCRSRRRIGRRSLSCTNSLGPGRRAPLDERFGKVVPSNYAYRQAGGAVVARSVCTCREEVIPLFASVRSRLVVIHFGPSSAAASSRRGSCRPSTRPDRTALHTLSRRGRADPRPRSHNLRVHPHLRRRPASCTTHLDVPPPSQHVDLNSVRRAHQGAHRVAVPYSPPNYHALVFVAGSNLCGAASSLPSSQPARAIRAGQPHGEHEPSGPSTEVFHSPSFLRGRRLRGQARRGSLLPDSASRSRAPATRPRPRRLPDSITTIRRVLYATRARRGRPPCDRWRPSRLISSSSKCTDVQATSPIQGSSVKVKVTIIAPPRSSQRAAVPIPRSGWGGDGPSNRVETLVSPAV